MGDTELSVGLDGAELFIGTADGWEPFRQVCSDGFTLHDVARDPVTFDYAVSMAGPVDWHDQVRQWAALNRVRTSAVAAWNEAQR